jgi:quercetin dioxygenase-like cupin family protein
VSFFADLPTIAPHRIWDGVSGRVLQGQRVTVAVVELDPDGVIPQHRHENEQVGLVVAGSLTFRVADEERELGPGGTWCIPAQVPHEVRTGPGGAVVVEAFAPIRDDWDRLDRDQPSPPRWPDRA